MARAKKSARTAAITPVVLGPWVRGLVNTVSSAAIPLDGLEDARDCDIGEDGFVTARGTYDLVSDDDAFKFLFEFGGISYAVSQGYAGILGEMSFTTIRPIVGDVGWAELNGAPIFCDSEGVYDVHGVRLMVRSTTEEEDRYGLVDMPGGRAVAYWQGRLLVLRGKSLLWSEPMDYGSHSPARNFVRFPTTPTWMAPLPGGVFVGLRDSVVFLSGNDPALFELRTVSGLNCPGCSLVLDARHFSPELAGGGGSVALWMSDVGFVVGRGDGSVVYPQAENISSLPVVPRNMAFIDDRVYAFATEG